MLWQVLLLVRLFESWWPPFEVIVACALTERQKYKATTRATWLLAGRFKVSGARCKRSGDEWLLKWSTLARCDATGALMLMMIGRVIIIITLVAIAHTQTHRRRETRTVQLAGVLFAARNAQFAALGRLFAISLSLSLSLFLLRFRSAGR